ncbi:MAG: hypothetical protein HRU26_03505 [Psychroserpens sp.]|nr:hypothetical protein [Psychroserpens sp.]
MIIIQKRKEENQKRKEKTESNERIKLMKDQQDNDCSASACYAIFHGEGGYPNQRERAKKLFRIGGQYKVIGGTMGRTSTSLKIEGVDGLWNSCFFNYDATIDPVHFGGYQTESNEGINL